MRLVTLWRKRRWWLAIYTGCISLVFAYTLADNCLERPDGLIIGSIFTVLLITASGLSRSIRSVEFRIPQGYFSDVESWRMGPELRGKKVHLVPIKGFSPEGRSKKKAEILRYYSVRGPFLFLHVNQLDNRSELTSPLEVTLRKDGDDYLAKVYAATAIANPSPTSARPLIRSRFSLASPVGT